VRGMLQAAVPRCFRCSASASAASVAALAEAKPPTGSAAAVARSVCSLEACMQASTL
jgi:hypothetical protein